MATDEWYGEQNCADNPWIEYERRKDALWDEPMTDAEYIEEIERILDDLGL